MCKARIYYSTDYPRQGNISEDLKNKGNVIQPLSTAVRLAVRVVIFLTSL